jgi:hypothetical protein
MDEATRVSQELARRSSVSSPQSRALRSCVSSPDRLGDHLDVTVIGTTTAAQDIQVGQPLAQRPELSAASS